MDGGVGFIINKKLASNVIQIDSIGFRVAFLMLRLNSKYRLKVIQVYAPTTTHSDEEVESFYEDIVAAMAKTPTLL